jgi:hypothetical protein
MTRIVVLVLLSAATACPCGGAYVAEAGFGAAAGLAGAAATRYAVQAVYDDETAANLTAIPAFIGGAAVGVWLAGETLDGRSANRPASFFGALGGSALGVAAGSGIMLLSLAATNGEGDAFGFALFYLGFAATVVSPPILSTVFYNVVKKPETPDKSCLTVTPTVAALPPIGRDDAPALVYGCTLSF